MLLDSSSSRRDISLQRRRRPKGRGIAVAIAMLLLPAFAASIFVTAGCGGARQPLLTVARDEGPDARAAAPSADDEDEETRQ